MCVTLLCLSPDFLFGTEKKTNLIDLDIQIDRVNVIRSMDIGYFDLFFCTYFLKMTFVA